jgi:hypothetical protein
MLGLDQEYELYTEAGNRLCHQLLSAVITDILEDKLTRKQAIAKVKEVIAEVRKIDDGMCDSEPLYAIWHRVNKAFKQVGYERFQP